MRICTVNSDQRPAGMILDQARIDFEATTGNWRNRLLTDYFAAALNDNPRTTALICYRTDTGVETTLCYADLDRSASNIAANLAALGICKGDVVSFQLPNWWQFVAVHLACLKIGAISNPLMPIFRARELEFMIGFAESRVFIAPKTFHKFSHETLAEELKRKIPALEHIFVVGGAGTTSFETALCADRGNPVPEKSPLSPNDVVQLLYTSGTTGRPKGVMHTSNTLLASVHQVAGRLRLEANDIGFMPAPFAHQIGFCFGMMMSITLGIPLVIMDAWEPVTAALLIARHRATFTCASTPFMADLANVPDVETLGLDCLRMFMTAGAPVVETIVEKLTEKLDINIVPGWGMTEVIQATATQPMSSLVLPLTDGFAFPGNEVRIIDDRGALLPPGKEGNLQCRGSTLFVGYHKKPDLYDVDDDGWFDTGDVARIDRHGNIRIVGRSKDIIIRGGENVPVHEVESIIYKLPEICDVALVAMPDPRLGERGCVFVTLKNDADLSFERLIKHLESHKLSRHYHPERLEILDVMPRTASGKIQKFVLRERAAKFVRQV